MDELRQEILALRDRYQERIDNCEPYSHFWYMNRISTLNEVLHMIDRKTNA